MVFLSFFECSQYSSEREAGRKDFQEQEEEAEEEGQEAAGTA